MRAPAHAPRRAPSPRVRFFVDWHLELGFDRMVMLDMSELGMSTPPTAPPGRLEIHRFPNTKNDAIREHQHLALDLPWVEWVFFMARRRHDCPACSSRCASF